MTIVCFEPSYASFAVVAHASVAVFAWPFEWFVAAFEIAVASFGDFADSVAENAASPGFAAGWFADFGAADQNDNIAFFDVVFNSCHIN